MVLLLYLLFFLAVSSSRARVCVYVCVYMRIRIHIRAPMARIIFYQCAIPVTLSGGWKIFFPMVGWLVGWLIDSWVEGPADLRRDV